VKYEFSVKKRKNEVIGYFYRENTENSRLKKVIRHFWTLNGNFPKKVIRKFGLRYFFSVPPKLGAKSPPMGLRISSMLFGSLANLANWHCMES